MVPKLLTTLLRVVKAFTEAPKTEPYNRKRVKQLQKQAPPLESSVSLFTVVFRLSPVAAKPINSRGLQPESCGSKNEDRFRIKTRRDEHILKVARDSGWQEEIWNLRRRTENFLFWVCKTRPCQLKRSNTRLSLTQPSFKIATFSLWILICLLWVTLKTKCFRS